MRAKTDEHFPIALGAGESALGLADGLKPEPLGAQSDGSDRLGALCIVAHHPALSHPPLARFELRLYEHQELGLGRKGAKRRQKDAQRNERGVHGNELDRSAERFARELPGVGALENPHPGIAAQLKVQLAIAHIDGDHPAGSVLQKAIGESAGRGADVETIQPAGVKGEIGEGARELLASPGDEGTCPAAKAHRRVGRYPCPRLLDGDVLYQHAPGQNKRLRPGSRLAKRALDDQLVEADLSCRVLALRSFGACPGG